MFVNPQHAVCQQLTTPIECSVWHDEQCDLIWRNFATLGKMLTGLRQLFERFRTWKILEPILAICLSRFTFIDVNGKYYFPAVWRWTTVQRTYPVWTTFLVKNQPKLTNVVPLHFRPNLDKLLRRIRLKYSCQWIVYFGRQRKWSEGPFKWNEKTIQTLRPHLEKFGYFGKLFQGQFNIWKTNYSIA